jgi:hypothetical protein
LPSSVCPPLLSVVSPPPTFLYLLPLALIIFFSLSTSYCLFWSVALIYLRIISLHTLMILQQVWGSCFSAQKQGMNVGIGPFTFNFARLVVGVLFLAPCMAVNTLIGRMRGLCVCVYVCLFAFV